MTFDDGRRHLVVEVLPNHATNGVDAGAIPVPPAGVLPEPASLAERKAPQQMTPAELRKEEGDVIDDLFRSDDRSKQEIGTLVLPRLQVRQFDSDGHVKRDAAGELVYGPLELRFRALRQSQIDEQRRKCGRVWEIGDDGTRQNVFDPTELNSRLVALSMVPEDRQKYLEDKRLWLKFEAGGPIDVVDKWLTAGELAKAGALVTKLSGIPMNAAMERLVLESSSAAQEGSTG